jgi:hypothetical protein
MIHRATTVAKIASYLLILVVTGCDERVAQVAREAADRQAEQNRAMVELQQEVAAGSRSLVAADAEARSELVTAQRELHVERSQLDRGRDALEVERRVMAAERRTASLLVPVLEALGTVLVALVVVGFSWFVLVRLRSDEHVDSELVEFLVQELGNEESAPFAPTRLSHSTNPEPSKQLTSTDPFDNS